MATLSVTDLAVIRSYAPEDWTPEEYFDDVAVNEAYQQNGGSVQLTAAHLVRKKLAYMLEDPDTFSIPGEYSQSGASQIAALREVAKRLEVQAAAAREVIAGAGTSFRGERVKPWRR